MTLKNRRVGESRGRLLSGGDDVGRQRLADLLGVPVIGVPEHGSLSASRYVHDVLLLDNPAPRVVVVQDPQGGDAASKVASGLTTSMQLAGVRVVVLDGLLLASGSSRPRSTEGIRQAIDAVLRDAELVVVVAVAQVYSAEADRLNAALLRCADAQVLAWSSDSLTVHHDAGVLAPASSAPGPRVAGAVLVGAARGVSWPAVPGSDELSRPLEVSPTLRDRWHQQHARVRRPRRELGTTRLVRPRTQAENEATSMRTTYRLLQVVVLTLIVLQRVVVPLNGISAAVPVVALVLLVLTSRRVLVADRIRTLLYLAAIGSCVAAALLSSTAFRRDLSVTSLLLLLVTYFAFCYRLDEPRRELYPRVLDFFNRVMLVAAALALLQWGAQMVGWQYEDLPATYLPPNVLAVDYNTFYPVYYGSPIMKTNAFVFLEPSFCSQFLALAILAQLILGKNRRRILVYAAAMLTTVSGTGILLLLLGLVALAVQRGGRWAVGMATAVGAVAIALTLTPVGSLLLSRTSEPGTQGSSGDARFVRPYVQVATALAEDSATFLVGRGPGASDRAVTFFNPGRVAANYPVLSKLAAEYGLAAMIVFGLFVLVVFFRGSPSTVLSLSAVVIYFVLSGSLLQPQTIYLCWLITGLFAGGSRQQPGVSSPELPRAPGGQHQPGPEVPAVRPTVLTAPARR